jgi:hypothetical protein
MNSPYPLVWPWRGARDALTALVDELEQRHVDVAVARAYPSVGLLLLSCGMTVWCYRRLLYWQLDDQVVTWPALDASGAARRLAEVARRGL